MPLFDDSNSKLLTALLKNDWVKSITFVLGLVSFFAVVGLGVWEWLEHFPLWTFLTAAGLYIFCFAVSVSRSNIRKARESAAALRRFDETYNKLMKNQQEDKLS